MTDRLALVAGPRADLDTHSSGHRAYSDDASLNIVRLRNRCAAHYIEPVFVEQLTERELEVLRLVAAGHANREIADELVVVLDTVKKHVSNILRKLGACNRTHSVARAEALGLLRAGN
ncbi:MAG TPA: helix-turn-helix transcriptional regulator [Chloroflexota bacterium]|jgi:LuxR family maltose regulon positive regulatory protein